MARSGAWGTCGAEDMEEEGRTSKSLSQTASLSAVDFLSEASCPAGIC